MPSTRSARSGQSSEVRVLGKFDDKIRKEHTTSGKLPYLVDLPLNALREFLVSLWEHASLRLRKQRRVGRNS